MRAHRNHNHNHDQGQVTGSYLVPVFQETARKASTPS
jgi:hypothetical protein